MSYYQEFYGQLFFHSGKAFDEALSKAMHAADEDAATFSSELLNSRISEHYFLVQWTGYRPASMWFNYHEAFIALCESAVSAFIGGEYYGEDHKNPPPGSVDTFETFSDHRSGLILPEYKIQEDPERLSLFPMKPGSRMHYASSGKRAAEQKLVFSEKVVEGYKLISSGVSFWDFFGELFMHEDNHIYIVFGSYLIARENYERFTGRSCCRQLLFHATMKPGDSNVVYTYLEDAFYVLTAEGYDEIQTPAGHFPRSLRIRVDACGKEGLHEQKKFPWEATPWGKYIRNTFFIWLFPGVGMVKYADENDETLLLISISG